MATKKTKYKKNFVKQVIFRLDYKRINSMNLSEKGAFFEKLKSKFPKFNELKNQSFELETATNLENFNFKRDQKIGWEFLSDDGLNRIVVDPDHVICETTNYVSFDSFRENIKFLLETVFQSHETTSFSRLGLRYVNIIELNKGNPLDWEGFISEKLLVVGDNFYNKLNKTMHLLEYKNEECALRFQYGIFNSEYPAPIARKEFVLDFDCYTLNIKNLDSALTISNNFHGTIKSLFEKSIGPKLRGVMKNGKE